MLPIHRLRRKTLITKVPGEQRYQLHSLGRRVAVVFSKTSGRVLAPELGAPDLAARCLSARIGVDLKRIPTRLFK